MIRVHRRQDYFLKKYASYIEKRMKIVFTNLKVNYWLAVRLNFVSYFISTSVVIMKGYCLYTENYEMITFLSLALTYTLNMNGSVIIFYDYSLLASYHG
jgi:hypothetical protein